jgi:AcrR family transcriptional regulator
MNDSQIEEASDTRRRLIQAAWTVMRTDGVRAATSRRVTETAGANLGAITYYFGAKDRLLAEAAIAGLDSWMRPLGEALLGDERDGGDRTGAVIASVLELLGGGRDNAWALLEALLARDVPDDVRRSVADHLSTFQAMVADLMRRERRRREIPASVNPDAMAGMFTAFALGLMAQEVIGANPAPIPDIVGQLLALLALARDK